MEEKIEAIKTAILDAIYGQISCLECVDAEELGEVVDILKDLEEACYYHHVVKAMEEKNENCIMPYEFGHMVGGTSDGTQASGTIATI